MPAELQSLSLDELVTATGGTMPETKVGQDQLHTLAPGPVADAKAAWLDSKPIGITKYTRR